MSVGRDRRARSGRPRSRSPMTQVAAFRGLPRSTMLVAIGWPDHGQRAGPGRPARSRTPESSWRRHRSQTPMTVGRDRRARSGRPRSRSPMTQVAAFRGFATLGDARGDRPARSRPTGGAEPGRLARSRRTAGPITAAGRGPGAWPAGGDPTGLQFVPAFAAGAAMPGVRPDWRPVGAMRRGPPSTGRLAGPRGGARRRPTRGGARRRPAPPDRHREAEDPRHRPSERRPRTRRGASLVCDHEDPPGCVVGPRCDDGGHSTMQKSTRRQPLVDVGRRNGLDHGRALRQGAPREAAVRGKWREAARSDAPRDVRPQLVALPFEDGHEVVTGPVMEQLRGSRHHGDGIAARPHQRDELADDPQLWTGSPVRVRVAQERARQPGRQGAEFRRGRWDDRRPRRRAAPKHPLPRRRRNRSARAGHTSAVRPASRAGPARRPRDRSGGFAARRCRRPAAPAEAARAAMPRLRRPGRACAPAGAHPQRGTAGDRRGGSAGRRDR